ncbi:MAG: hypothetical protein ACLGG5_02915 [Thermoleophilia bacterium]
MAVKAAVSGLSPQTTYHLRVVAQNGETVSGPDRLFSTFGIPPQGLPDGRAYEQVSPVDKNAGDAYGTPLLARASADGQRATFFSTFGFPGGEGEQELPLYLSSRSSDWSTQGLLPAPSVGQRVEISGWSPDLSTFFEKATRFGEPLSTALLSRSEAGALTEVTPYVGKANYFFAGSSTDGSVVLFESPANLGTTPPGLQGASNVYAWNRATDELRLVSIENDGAAPSAAGSFAGPYDWVGSPQPTVTKGGAARDYYLQDEHALASDGKHAYFTAAGGQLYLRRNPAEKQSEMSGAECIEPEKACTFHVSASRRSIPDPAGTRPAAFMAATSDGSKAYFTSPEKLTNDATTGPEPAIPEIGRANLADGSGKDEEFLLDKASGLAVGGEYLYWADPTSGTIGRAKLNGAGAATDIEPEFIEGAGVPQYVAVDSQHIYWTNKGDGADGHGTIGRAEISGAGTPELEFITGASNPQGIAVNSEYVFWGNSGATQTTTGIGRAEISGGNVNQTLIETNGSEVEGVAVEGAHVYWGEFEPSSGSKNSNMRLADLDGKNQMLIFVGGHSDVRGVAVDAGHVYWVLQGFKKIERANLNLEGVESLLGAEGHLKGLAVDSEHVYWSANGEPTPNPGNDLYRYDADTGDLTDLLPDPSTPNGAEVQGVLGVSKDGSYIYFAANAALPGSGAPGAGDCHGSPLNGSGKCNLYLLHDGQLTFIAQLELTGNPNSDVSNWLGTSTSGGLVPDSSNFGKTSRLGAGGRVLLFRSQLQLTSYDNEGMPELYLHKAGDPELSCVSCDPTGVAPAGQVSLGNTNPPALPLERPAATLSRNLNAEGNRVFFETMDPLQATDTNGNDGCPGVGSEVQNFPSCEDIYEWEAPGVPGCTEGAPGYNAANGGCVFLISTGKSKGSSLFADASESGDNVFFFTRQSLVGQDKDELFDLYDARVGGGIAAQNPSSPVACESAESCRPGSPPPSPTGSAGSASFVGPGNPKAAHKHAKRHRHKRKHKRHSKHSGGHKHRHTSKRGAGR